MSLINDYVGELKPYMPASHKVWALNAKERAKSLKLDWNEASIPPAPEVRTALLEAMQDEALYNLYPPTQNDELIQMLCEYTNVDAGNVQYFASSDALHEYIAKLCISVGDSVVVLWPSYDNFRLAIEACGATVHYSELTKQFEFDEDRFRRDIESTNCKMAYICNPNNPSGTFVSSAVIESLACEYPQVLFLVDEAYCEFAHGTVANLAVQHGNIMVTRTMSKAFALAGFRFGYLIASKDNVDAINKIRNTKSVPYFTQVAVMAALSNTAYMERYVSEVRRARSMFIDTVNEQFGATGLHAYPSEGNFTLLECGSTETKAKLLSGLEQKRVFVRNTQQSKSVETCVRVTIGTRSQMMAVIEDIRICLGVGSA